jgi:hypothetical protein
VKNHYNNKHFEPNPFCLENEKKPKFQACT